MGSLNIGVSLTEAERYDLPQLGLIKAIVVGSITKEKISMKLKCKCDTMLARNTHGSLDYTTF